MNSSPAHEESMAPPVQTGAARVSKLLRRVHMFAGLFLGPWMLMYACSTLVMTHRDYVLSFYPSKSPAMTTERELNYTRSFPATLAPEKIAPQILEDLGLGGRHAVSGGKNGRPLVINRQQALSNRRITFEPDAHKIVIQHEEFRALTFLERMHRRRGYDQPYALEDTWGFSVDVAVVAMMFWSLSGIWLWWEMKLVRGWGALAFLAGMGLFAVFLVLL